MPPTLSHSSVLSSIPFSSQGALHEPWGGVVPDLARRAHEEAIGGVVAKALANAGVQPSQLSAVAVTVGPGLSLCLRVGVLEARRICAENGVPMVPVHHMEVRVFCRVPDGRESAPTSCPSLPQRGNENAQARARAAPRVLRST